MKNMRKDSRRIMASIKEECESLVFEPATKKVFSLLKKTIRTKVKPLNLYQFDVRNIEYSKDTHSVSGEILYKSTEKSKTIVILNFNIGPK